MPTPNSKTNLIFHYRRSGVQVRLVVMNKKIEIYTVQEDGSKPRNASPGAEFLGQYQGLLSD